MITAGIDAGNESLKLVLMNEEQIVGKSRVPTGIYASETAQETLDRMLEEINLTTDQIACTVATGAARNDINLAQHVVTEVAADCRGVFWQFPEARSLVDIGAEECRAVSIDDQGNPRKFVKNDKCASGVGIFVRAIAKIVEVPLEEVGPLALKSEKNIEEEDSIVINTMCAVFAESEVISLVHSGIPKHDILRAVHDAIAARTRALVNRVKSGGQVVVIGGLAKNVGFVDSLKRKMDDPILVPETPEFYGAIGAALIARQRVGTNDPLPITNCI